MLKYMCSSPCLALEVRGEDVVRRFRDLCGPFDVQVAKTLRPDSLRARFGRSNIYNALHCTDCPEDGVLECQFVFRSLSS
jgi:nucleoside-diphosphate kinase